MRNNIGLFFAKQTMLNPNREAIVDVNAGKRYTYAEANLRMNRVASAARSAGVDKGDRVATLLMNGHEFVEVFYGLAKIGAVTVALNWRLVADELAFILGDSGAKTLIFDSAFTEVATELHRRGADATSVTAWVHVGDPGTRPEFAVGYEDLLAAASDEEPVSDSADDDLLFIMYTSGTTGLPKGVMHSHSTTMWAIITGAATAEMRKGDRYLICLPLFHVGATNPLFSTFYQGERLSS
ncbi:MAG: AMP-binding protein [Acidimicrobiales bacterium]